MVTIAQAVEKVILDKPFISEALSDGIINVSSLARMITTEVEQILQKKVNQGALVMAINRLVPQLDVTINRDLNKMIGLLGDIIVRSNLTDYTFRNSDTLVDGHMNVFKSIRNNSGVFYTLVRGVFESNLVISSNFKNLVDDYFGREELLQKSESLSAITLKLHENNMQISGFYYFILKALAWEGINILEVISTTNEFTVLLKNQDIDRAFSILKQIGEKK